MAKEEHAVLFGTKLPFSSEDEVLAAELGFMICAVREFIITVNQPKILICLHEKWAAMAMALGDQHSVKFTLTDACRHDYLHVVYTKPWLEDE